MTRLPVLTPATAVGVAKEILTDLVTRNGDVGAMVATMAHSTAVLGGYLHLSRNMKRAKLSRRTSELMSIAVQARLGCQLCLQAHIDAARRLGWDNDAIDAAAAGAPATSTLAPEVAAMVRLALDLYLEPTAISDDQVAELRAHGYSNREIADAVGVVALNVLTGSFNLLAGLEPD